MTTEMPPHVKAMNVLLAFLTDDQREELQHPCGYGMGFSVAGSRGGRFFIRVDGGVAGNVMELDAEGNRVAFYCAYPPGVPEGDVFLAQKLALETNEEAFIDVAYPAVFGFGRFGPMRNPRYDVDIYREAARQHRELVQRQNEAVLRQMQQHIRRECR